jgi:hypothetical protein
VFDIDACLQALPNGRGKESFHTFVANRAEDFQVVLFTQDAEHRAAYHAACADYQRFH